MTFREDECRVCQSADRKNLNVLRHIALSRPKQADAKFSLRNTRKTVSSDDSYLAKLLFEAPTSMPPVRTSGSWNIRRR